MQPLIFKNNRLYNIHFMRSCLKSMVNHKLTYSVVIDTVNEETIINKGFFDEDIKRFAIIADRIVIGMLYNGCIYIKNILTADEYRKMLKEKVIIDNN